MSEPSYSTPDPFPGSEPTPATAGGPQRYLILTLAAWLLILLGIGFMSGTVVIMQFASQRGTKMSQGEFLNLGMTAKSLLAMPWSEEDKVKQLEQLAIGPLDQRYGHTILLNELVGPEKAIEQLAKIDEAVAKRNEALTAKEAEHAEAGEQTDEDKLTEVAEEAEHADVAEEAQVDTGNVPSKVQVELRRVIGGLYKQYSVKDFDTSKLPEEDRQLLIENLGFVGELALLPKGTPATAARQKIDDEISGVMNSIIGGALIGFFAMLAAMAAAVTLYGIWYFRNSSSYFQDQSQRGFVYLETFALWLGLFLALQLMAGMILAAMGQTNLILQISPLLFFGSLLALIWPCLRGVPWSAVCKDIGWQFRNPVKEAAVGLFCYLALLLPLFLGIVTTSVLEYQATQLFPPGEFESRTTVSHPIEEEIASGDPMVWLMMYVATCVAAPIVEETVFRGVLYRYLRDGARKRFSRGLSIAVAAVVNAVLFAAIHPQGIIAVPLLSTLAIGFSLVREWRGSLIAPMVMHAIHNFIVTTFAITMMG